MTMLNSVLFIIAGIAGILLIKLATKFAYLIFGIIILIGVLGIAGYDSTDFITGIFNETLSSQQQALINKSLELKDCIAESCACNNSLITECIAKTILANMTLPSFNFTLPGNLTP